MIDVRLADGDASGTDASSGQTSNGDAGIAPIKVARASTDLLRTEGAEHARNAEVASLEVSRLNGEQLTALVEGLYLGSYKYMVRNSVKRAGGTGGTGGMARTVVLTGASSAEAADALNAGRENALATMWARDLANTPSDIKNPAWLADEATALGADGVDVQIRDEHWLVENHFGGIVTVGQGSPSPPRLIEASWRPRRAVPRTHVVLVGKGITFDTGGLNLKPGDSMRSMHTDMSGGAAVLAAMRRIARRDVRVRVTALVPSAENSFGGGSYRPSDVIRHYGGRTSEIGNTDAEGRLVVGDAIAYAAAKLRPTVIVDIATLTGAMKVALGLGTGGLFATDDRLAKQLVAAGEATGEPVWRMPLVEDYAGLLASQVADANNSAGNPGAVTAALFLRPFTAGLPWAHLDIAGPARAGRDAGIISKGATGFGARLLAAWVESLA